MRRAGAAPPCSALDPAPLAEYAIAGGEGAGARRWPAARWSTSPARPRGCGCGPGWPARLPCCGSCTCRCARRARDRRGDARRRQRGRVRRGVAPTLSRLAGQAAVALAEAGALAQRNWLSQVNAAVLDCVREGIALVGLDHELVFANAAMEQLAARLSMPIAAAIGARGADVVRRRPRGLLRRLGDDPRRHRRADRRRAAVSGMVLERYTAPVDDDAGARIGRLVVLRDVTREREAEQLKSDLMATVSHELRTPLASVLGYAELLRTRRLEPAARDEILGTVHREAKRLSALIDDFLDLQAIEQDRLMLSREPSRSTTCWPSRSAPSRGQSTAAPLAFSLVRDAGRRLRRPRPDRPGRREPALQRDQVLARRRRRRRLRLMRTRASCCVAVADSGPRHPRGRAGARLREVLPRPALPGRASAAPASASPWRTRSSSPTAGTWASRAPRASAPGSGSRSRPSDHSSPYGGLKRSAQQHLHSFSWGVPVEGLAGAAVEFGGDLVEF